MQSPIYIQKKKGKKNSINQGNLHPVITYETPSGLLSKLQSISQRQDKIENKPLQYILKNDFLAKLQADISDLSSKLGEISDLFPVPSEMIRRKVNESSRSDSPENAPANYAVHFKIGEESFYVFDSQSNRPLIIGAYSSKEKGKKYRSQLGHSVSFCKNTDDKKSMKSAIDLLFLADKIIVHPEQGKEQLQDIENDTIRRKGFQILYGSSSAAEKARAKKLIRLELGRMEKFSLLSDLGEKDGLNGMDTKSWEALQDSIRGRRNVSFLPIKELVYFIKPADNNPVVGSLLDEIRGSMGLAAQQNYEEFRKKFSASDKLTQEVMIAKYLTKRNGEEQQRVIDCIALLGEENEAKIRGIANVLNEK